MINHMLEMQQPAFADKEKKDVAIVKAPTADHQMWANV